MTDHGIFIIHFSELGKNAEFSRRAWAYFTFIKNDPFAGQVEWWQRQAEGERLGMAYEAEASSFVHEVLSPMLDLKVLVSFETGLTIRSISAGKESEVTLRACLVPVWPASPTCPGPVVVKVRMDEITLEDGEGELHVFRKPSPPHAALGRCRIHGGTRESPSWTEAQARAQRESDAKGWLWRADQDWLSRNPRVRKLAQETYRRLLKDYSREQPVVLNLERIKSRIEADAED